MEMSVLGTVDTKSNYNKNSLTNVVEKAHAGNTLLFLGAGFSIGCENKANKPIPLAKELSEIICKLGDFEVDDDLAFSADYYLKYHEASTLISLIKNYFTVVNASDHHQQIANVNWRRVYTTNYDNCFEVASIGVKKAIQPVTLLDNPTKYFRSRDICVHINGSVQCVGVDSLDQSFKLSDSSYTNSDAFTDSSWYYRFKKDIELCSQIIFVGYSLYDMEVKRLLLDNDDIKNKTFFITRKDISKKEHHRLSAFGEIFPIGVESFASLVSKTRPQGLPEDIKYLSSFERQFIDFEDRYGDSDIRDFLLRGKCANSTPKCTTR